MPRVVVAGGGVLRQLGFFDDSRRGGCEEQPVPLCRQVGPTHLLRPRPLVAAAGKLVHLDLSAHIPGGKWDWDGVVHVGPAHDAVILHVPKLFAPDKHLGVGLAAATGHVAPSFLGVVQGCAASFFASCGQALHVCECACACVCERGWPDKTWTSGQGREAAWPRPRDHHEGPVPRTPPLPSLPCPPPTYLGSKQANKQGRPVAASKQHTGDAELGGGEGVGSLLAAGVLCVVLCWKKGG